MSNATRVAITKLTAHKDPAKNIAVLDGYIAGILKQLARGAISQAKAHRDLDEAYGYREFFIAEVVK
jgi:hypothetical protein